MTDRISNAYNSAVGGAKETIGNVTGSERLAGSGAAQKAEAQTKQQTQDTQTHALGVGHNVEGATQQATGRMVNDPYMEARGQGNQARGDMERNV
ncbi:hypothetical protein BGX28_006185 [Mortierella sp. GBA30]|nr:hypothetical protein BGX28_006185 [Mortierella sp. GBA30]